MLPVAHTFNTNCRLFEFIDTPCEEEADEKQLEPKGEPVPHVERLQSIDDELRSSPGFKFITRPDLYQYAQVSCNSTCAYRECV